MLCGFVLRVCPARLRWHARRLTGGLLACRPPTAFPLRCSLVTRIPVLRLSMSLWLWPTGGTPSASLAGNAGPRRPTAAQAHAGGQRETDTAVASHSPNPASHASMRHEMGQYLAMATTRLQQSHPFAVAGPQVLTATMPCRFLLPNCRCERRSL